MSFDNFYMRENPFYYPEMTPDEYEEVLHGLADRNDNIIENVKCGRLILKPVEERSKDYIYEILGIKNP